MEVSRKESKQLLMDKKCLLSLSTNNDIDQILATNDNPILLRSISSGVERQFNSRSRNFNMRLQYIGIFTLELGIMSLAAIAFILHFFLDRRLSFSLLCTPGCRLSILHWAGWASGIRSFKSRTVICDRGSVEQASKFLWPMAQW